MDVLAYMLSTFLLLVTAFLKVSALGLPSFSQFQLTARVGKGDVWISGCIDFVFWGIFVLCFVESL